MSEQQESYDVSVAQQDGSERYVTGECSSKTEVFDMISKPIFDRISQEPIEVRTRYIWEAVYDHGESSLVEWERMENGELIEHVFADIDLPRCTGFILHKLVDGEAASVQIDHASGQRLIFFRRHQSTLNFETGEVTKHEPIHVIGWQRTVHGTNVSSYLYIFPDGSLFVSDKHDAV